MDGADGSRIDESRKLAVWDKGQAIPGFCSAIWRHDRCGRPMRFADFDDRHSRFGWSIEPVRPGEPGGDRTVDNLRPVHCGRWYAVARRAPALSERPLVAGNDDGGETDFDLAFRTVLAAE